MTAYTLPLDHPAHRANLTAAQLIAIVPEAAANLIWVDRSMPNASDYLNYRLVPGAYPVQFVDMNHRPLPADATGGETRSYYVRVEVEVDHLGGGGTNRLFTASSHVEYPALGRTTRWFSTYAYYASPGHVLASADAPTKDDRWHREPILVINHL